MKKLLSFISLILMTLIVFTFAACNPKEEDEGGNQFKNVSIYHLYRNRKDTSFAKLTVSSIDENIYCDSNSATTQYLLLECVVEEDYYERIPNGTTIILPIVLNKLNGTYYDEKVLIEWFEENEYVLAYFEAVDDRFEIKNIVTGEIHSITYKYSPCGLARDIIPIRQNKVDFVDLDFITEGLEVSHEAHGDYVKFIKNGMTLEEVSENIRNLAELAK